MRYLITAVLLAAIPLALGEEPKEKEKRDLKKEKSIFDEFDVETPDFSKLPEEERLRAELEWYEEHVGTGIPKTYVRFMERLRREAKKPAEGSKYVGSWGEKADSRKPQLVLAADGSFTWVYGHSRGIGKWREHAEGIIWIGFAHTERDEAGKEHTWYATHYCILKDEDTLVQDHIDYTDTYKRLKLADAKGESGGEQDGADQPATAPKSKPEGKEKPEPETGPRSQ